MNISEIQIVLLKLPLFQHYYFLKDIHKLKYYYFILIWFIAHIEATS